MACDADATVQPRVGERFYVAAYRMVSASPHFSRVIDIFGQRKDRFRRLLAAVQPPLTFQATFFTHSVAFSVLFECGLHSD